MNLFQFVLSLLERGQQFTLHSFGDRHYVEIGRHCYIFSRMGKSTVVSYFGFLGQHHALYRDLATMGAVKYAPQGQIVGSVLELMLGPRSHEQDVA